MSVIIDKCADAEVFDFLSAAEIDFYRSCDMKNLYFPVNTHPDMQLHFVTPELAFVAPSAFEHYRKSLPARVTLCRGYSDPGRTYPYDCAYNIARIGRYVIGNLRYTDKRILEYYSSRNYEFINVRQGYTKCNICIISENTAVTEDEGIYKALLMKNINVLKVPSGEIALKGFDRGFIGGATGFVAEKTLAFFGDAQGLSYKNELFELAKESSVDIISLSSTNVKDFGSLIYF